MAKKPVQQQETGFLIKDAVYVDGNGTRHDPRGDYPGGWRNPGNVEPGAVAYPGEDGTVKTKSGRKFLKFKTAQDGLNAMGQSVGQMVRVKIPAQFKAGLLGSDKFTVENLVSVYAPSSDANDTEDYVKFVSKRTGLDRAKELRLDDRATMASLLEAMVRRDSGHAHADWFRRDEYEAAAGRMGVAAETRQAAKGGEASGGAAEKPAPQDAAPAADGPRIVVNPTTFRNGKDALCVAFNEALRIVMEVNGFEPQAEPAPAQRRFFADTAYAKDELQMRRTILARVCVFDTSVKDPTREQLEEAVEFLETVMEIGAPQNEWEQSCVRRMHDALVRRLESGEGASAGGGRPEPPEDSGTVEADVGGGTAEDEAQRASAAALDHEAYAKDEAQAAALNHEAYAKDEAQAAALNHEAVFEPGRNGAPERRDGGWVDQRAPERRGGGWVDQRAPENPGQDRPRGDISNGVERNAQTLQERLDARVQRFDLAQKRDEARKERTEARDGARKARDDARAARSSEQRERARFGGKTKDEAMALVHGRPSDAKPKTAAPAASPVPMPDAQPAVLDDPKDRERRWLLEARSFGHVD